MNENMQAYRKPTLVVIFLVFLVIIALYLWALKPLEEEYTMTQQELTTVSNEVSTLQAQLDQLQPEDIDEATLVEFIEGVPVSPYIQQIILDIETISEMTGVAVDSITFSVNRAGEDDTMDTFFSERVTSHIGDRLQNVSSLHMSSVEMNIALDGDRDRFNQFVYLLQQMPRIMHVMSFAFADEGIAEGNTTVAVEEDEADENGDTNNNAEEDEQLVDDLNGNVTLRAYFSSDFAPFIPEDVDFYGLEQDELDEVTEIEVDMSPPSTSTDDLENSEDLASLIEELSSQIDVFYTPGLSVSNADQSFRYYVVQIGAYFTTTEFLDRFIETVTDVGIQPRINVDRLGMVYAGTSASRDVAVQKANYLGSRGFDTFVKPKVYRIPANEEGSLDALFTQAHLILGELSEITANAMTEGSISIADDEWADLNAMRDEYTTLVSDVLEEGNHENRAAYLEQSAALLTQSMQALNSFEQNSNMEHLWESEAFLLDFVLTLNSFNRLDVS